jgi:mannose-6-phosphate isomerase-like protein (cupin superfamily)
MIEQIKHGDMILGILIRRDFQNEQIAFFTPDAFSQQLGYMNRPKGYRIAPHVHRVVERKVELTQEVLFIKKGEVRVDFYDNDRIYLESRIVKEGDIILLAHGGHGFQMLEPSEIIEVKQGPYCGEMDKVRFETVSDDKIVIK